MAFPLSPCQVMLCILDGADYLGIYVQLPGVKQLSSQGVGKGIGWFLTCSMSLLKPPPKHFYPGVNLDFSGCPPPPLVDGTWKNSELWPYYRFWDMNKYEEI